MLAHSVFDPVLLFIEIGQWRHESGSQTPLWHHNGEDAIDHFHGEFQTKTLRQKSDMHYFLYYFICGNTNIEIWLQNSDFMTFGTQSPIEHK